MPKKMELQIDFFGLVNKLESELGRDVTNREIAAGTGLSEHAIGRWRKNNVSQFTIPQLEVIINYFREYFDCTLIDLIIQTEVEIDLN